MGSAKDYAYSLIGQPSSTATRSSSQSNHKTDAWREGRLITALTLLVIALMSSNLVLLTLYNKEYNGLEFKSPHTDLSRRPTERMMGYHHPAYSSHNITEADEAWSEMEPGHGVVAVEKQWALDRGLPPTREWKPDRSKVVYALATYHSIHCVPLVRRVLRKLIKGEALDDWETPHTYHCLAIIREELMCTADDTLLAADLDENNEVVPIGKDQPRQCRNWEAIRDWATAHNACYLTVQDHPNATSYWDNCADGDGIRIPDNL